MKLKPITIKRLRIIQKKILAEPENFDMHGWHCGTAHCIGGWAIILFPKSGPNLGLATLCAILELDEVGKDKLCYLGCWPKSYDKAYLKARSKQERAKIACQRIDHFIKTGGRE